MKKLLSILFILSGFIAKAQIPVVRSSAALTVEDYRLYALYNFRLPVFADTTAANLVKGLDSVGTMINIRNSPDVMVRVFQGGAKKWVFPTGGSGGAVSSVFGRTGAVVAVNTDYSAYYPLLATVYTNPSWIGSLAASKISGTATVTAGSSKILLGGTPAGATLQPFSIDVNQSALNLSLIGGALSISQISATGTANSTTFLRGDGSWSSPGSTITGLPNSNIGTGFRWAIPLTNDVKTAFARGYLVLDSTTNTNGITFYPDTSAGKLATKTDVAAVTTSLSGYVQSVTGTTNRLTSTGGQNPVLNVSATFEALLGKVANRIDQNNAATTSAQLASVISDETGTAGNLVFSTSPLFTTPRLASTSTAGYVWTATDGIGNGSWQPGGGGGGGGTLVNLGTGFRWAFAGTNNIKTAVGTAASGILIDSSSTTLNFKVDSSLFATRYYIDNLTDSVNVTAVGADAGAVQALYAIHGDLRSSRLAPFYGINIASAPDSGVRFSVDTTLIVSKTFLTNTLTGFSAPGFPSHMTTVPNSANYTATYDGMFILGNLAGAANRTFTFPAAVQRQAYIIKNNSTAASGFTWSIAGRTIYNADNTTLTAFASETDYIIIDDGVNLNVVSKYDMSSGSGGGDYTVASAANTANYTITTANFVTLADLTGQANRNLVMPAASSGKRYVIKNNNTSGSTFNWSFSGRTVKDFGNNTITTIPLLTVVQLIDDGTNLNIIN